MRFQITFTKGPDWKIDPDKENLARALELAREPYRARVYEITLPVHVEASHPGGPFRERMREEKAAIVEITLEALAEYCSDRFVTATLIAQDNFDLADDDTPVTHHIFISDASGSETSGEKLGS